LLRAWLSFSYSRPPVTNNEPHPLTHRSEIKQVNMILNTAVLALLALAGRQALADWSITIYDDLNCPPNGANQVHQSGDAEQDCMEFADLGTDALSFDFTGTEEFQLTVCSTADCVPKTVVLARSLAEKLAVSRCLEAGCPAKASLSKSSAVRLSLLSSCLVGKSTALAHRRIREYSSGHRMDGLRLLVDLSRVPSGTSKRQQRNS
jgi:hypothetical protein